ncbi:hypothetical protein LINPERHAP1_LOCUS15969, partial [Linum perenne]
QGLGSPSYTKAMRNSIHTINQSLSCIERHRKCTIRTNHVHMEPKHKV